MEFDYEQINSLVKKALDYKDQKQFKKSINILESIVNKYPDYSKINGVMVVLAGNYYKLKNYENTICFANKILLANPNIELASLLLYLAYFDLDKHEKAFDVLFNYLDKYPANLFRDTLEELLEGLLKNYGTTHKDKIILYAKNNNVVIPPQLRKE